MTETQAAVVAQTVGNPEHLLVQGTQLAGGVFSLVVAIIFIGRKLLNTQKKDDATTTASVAQSDATTVLFETLRKEIADLRAANDAQRKEHAEEVALLKKEIATARKRERNLEKQRSLLEALCRKQGIDVELEYSKVGIEEEDDE